MSRVLVTGANGFVGRHACRYLLDRGWTVRAAVRRGESAGVLTGAMETVVVGDLERFRGWSSLLTGVDAIVHSAARAHAVQETTADPWSAYYQANVAATRQLLSAAKSFTIRRFVFLSSIMAVGDGQDQPYTELDPCHPKTPYGRSKLAAERVVANAIRGSDVETTILRPPLVYGPGVGGNYLRLMRFVQRKRPLPLGMINNSRSMIYIDNLCGAIHICLSHPRAAGEIFHVADDESISTKYLAQSLAECMGQSTRLLPIPIKLLRLVGKLAGKSSDVDRLTRSLTVSAEKARVLLQWQPTICVNEGIRRTILDFQESVACSDYPRRVAA